MIDTSFTAPAAHPRPQTAARHGVLPLRLALGMVLLGSLAVRLFGLGWGIPHYDAALLPHGSYRQSYHLDEDNYLWGLAQMRPAQGNFDVHDYHWGTLQFYLIYGVLVGAETVGIVPAPWEPAFVQGDAAVLPRLFILGRLVSVAAGVAGTAIVIALGRALGGGRAGLAAGVAYALAPFAVVEAHYLTNDISASVLAAAAVLAAVWAVQEGRWRGLIGAGVLLGLATAAKYSIVFAVPALVVAQTLFLHGAARRASTPRIGIAAILMLPWLAVAGGFLLGEPYTLLQPADVLRGLHDVAQANGADLSGGLGLPIRMLGWQASNLAGLGLTWPVAVLALGGLGVMIADCGLRIAESRRPLTAGSRPDHGSRITVHASRFTHHVSHTPPAALILLAAGAGLAGGLVFNRIFMLRYSQPLVPLLAVAAGVGWAAIPRSGWRTAAGLVAVLVAGAMTLGQLSLLAGPHPADALVVWLDAHLQPGQQVARLWPEYSDLDANRYQLIRLDPWRPDVPPGAPPDYIVLDDMQLGPATPALTTLLAQQYMPVARFAARPHIGPFAWDEGPTPHDWKYSHPAFVVYARQP